MRYREISDQVEGQICRCKAKELLLEDYNFMEPRVFRQYEGIADRDTLRGAVVDSEWTIELMPSKGTIVLVDPAVPRARTLRELDEIRKKVACDSDIERFCATSFEFQMRMFEEEHDPQAEEIAADAQADAEAEAAEAMVAAAAEAEIARAEAAEAARERI